MEAVQSGRRMAVGRQAGRAPRGAVAEGAIGRVYEARFASACAGRPNGAPAGKASPGAAPVDASPRIRVAHGAAQSLGLAGRSILLAPTQASLLGHPLPPSE